ncbi:MAG TPA: TlpA disulfide reductase family protein [Symbiobacteriaceae bacterium]
MKTRSFRNTVLAALGALLLLAGAVGCGSARRDGLAGSGTGEAAEAAAEPRPLPGYPAPEITGRDVRSGETVQLTALRGNVVMISFWATWCPRCQEQMPDVEAFFRERGDTVKVIAVAADGSEPPEALAVYAEKHDLSVPVLYDGGLAGETYRAFALPTTVFVDPDGVVRIRVTGPLTREQMAQLAAKTEALRQ